MEQRSKIIGDITYLVTEMDAIRALQVQTKFIKLLGPGADSLIEQGVSIKEKLKVLIPKLMESFDDEMVNKLIISLFEKGVFVKENGVPKVLDFTTHFTGKPFEIWKVVWFILEVNFNLGELEGSDLPTI